MSLLAAVLLYRIFNMEGSVMRLLRLILQWFRWLRGWKCDLPGVDSHAWQNKDEIYSELKSHYW
jgi:hypothetical protein